MATPKTKLVTSLALGLVLWRCPAWAQPTPNQSAPAALIGWEEVDPSPTAGTRPSPPVKVTHIDVKGNTLLTPDQLRTLIGPWEGRDLTLGELKELAKNVTALYQRNGFYLAHAIVPPQPFDNGQIYLQVVEGKIGKITVKGAEHYPSDYILARFQRAFPDGNFRSDDFQRAMLLLNELPDLKVRAVMTPGQAAGTADVVLQVEDSTPIHGGLDYNNYGNKASGQNRVGATFEAGNLLTSADELTLRGVVGFPTQQNTYIQAQYDLPLNLDGTVLSASYANGAFDDSQGLQTSILDVRGKADIYTLAVAHPLDRELDLSTNLALAVSHKSLHNSFFAGTVPFSRDEYTTARLSYQADWRGSDGRTVLQAAWTQGLGGTGSSDPLVSRAGASGGFSKFNFDIARIQNIQTGLYGVLRGQGQVATQPLYVAEQFAMGGPDTVRGYPQAQLLGDNAYLVSAELRWSPFLDNLDVFQMAFFIDHGGVSLNRRLPGDLPYGSSLTGAGLGLRFGLSEHANLRFDVGFPISPNNNNIGQRPALYTSLQTRF